MKQRITIKMRRKLKNKDFYTVNVISYDEEKLNEKTGEVNITNFFIHNIIKNYK